MILGYASSSAKKVGHFTAKDPWNGNQHTTFLINIFYRGGVVPAYAALDERSRVSHYSLQSQIDKLQRGLPDSLVSLWLEEKVPPERLPELLMGLEPQLVRSDYVAHLTLNTMQQRVRTFGRWSLVAIGAFLVLMALPEVGTIEGLVMTLSGLLLGGAALFLGGRFTARRKQQTEWIMSQ